MPESDRIAIGLVQMTCAPADKPANLERAEHLLSELAGRVRIACLPEMFEVGYDLRPRPSPVELAEPVPGPISQHLPQLARKLGLAIVAGVTERDPDVEGLLYDTTALVDRNGELVGRYRKSHLHPSEHGFFRPGDELPVFELEGLRVGIAICFEHAFPQILPRSPGVAPRSSSILPQCPWASVTCRMCGPGRAPRTIRSSSPRSTTWAPKVGSHTAAAARWPIRAARWWRWRPTPRRQPSSPSWTPQ